MTRMMPAAPRFRSVIALAVLLTLVLVESIALVDQILFPNYELMLGSVFLQLSKGLFWALAPLSAGLLLMLIFVSPIRYLFDLGSRRSGLFSRFHRWISTPLAPVMRKLTEQLTERRISLTLQASLLTGAVLSGIAIGLTPYRPDLNPQGALVGVDTSTYSNLVGNMLVKNVTDAVRYSFVDPTFKGSRPLALLFLYGLATISGFGADGALRLAPAFLASLLACTSFTFVRYGLGDRRAAALAALLSVCSYQVSVGIWAGYYANWLALAESYLLLTSVLLFAKARTRGLFASMLSASVAILFTHPWTWTIMVALVAVLALDSYLRKTGMIPWVPIAVLLAANLILDLARIFFIGSYGGEQAGYDVAKSVSPLDIFQAWPNALGVFSYYDGYLANALYIALAFVAIVAVYRAKDEFSRTLIIWTALPALPFMFFNSLLQTRLVYVTPIPVLAVIGLLRVTQNLTRKAQVLLFVTFVVLFGANAAIMSMIQLVSISG